MVNILLKHSLQPYKLHKLESGPPPESKITRSDALTYYQRMKAIRSLEGAVVDLFKSDHVRGQSHLSTGMVSNSVCHFVRHHKFNATLLSMQKWYFFSFIYIISKTSRGEPLLVREHLVYLNY